MDWPLDVLPVLLENFGRPIREARDQNGTPELRVEVEKGAPDWPNQYLSIQLHDSALVCRHVMPTRQTSDMMYVGSIARVGSFATRLNDLIRRKFHG